MEQGHDHHDHGFDDETAEWYVKNYGDHPTNRLTVELAELAPDDVVVDVGAGDAALDGGHIANVAFDQVDLVGDFGEVGAFAGFKVIEDAYLLPLSSRKRTMLLPMKPAPPVTSDNPI